jgi:hypothetical protein
MYARVARWEGADPQIMREMVEDMRKDAAAGGRPPGDVPAVGGTVLFDADRGTSMAILLFESQEDMRKSDEILNAINPPRETGGPRVRRDCSRWAWISGNPPALRRHGVRDSRDNGAPTAPRSPPTPRITWTPWVTGLGSGCLRVTAARR